MDWVFETDKETKAMVAIVKTDLDLYSAPAFTVEAIAKIEEGYRKLVIDISAVEYLDSTGVGGIIRILQRMAREKGMVCFCGIAGTPRKVLEMSNIITLLREFPDRVAALSAEARQ